MKKILLLAAAALGLAACAQTPDGVRHVNAAYESRLDWDAWEGRGTLHVPVSELFDPTFSYPRPSSTKELRKIADAMLSRPGTTLTIVSHDYSDGRPQRALVESEKRAVAIQSIIVSAGVDVSRVRAFGSGDMRPVASNYTPEGRAENQRIEFVFNKGE